MKKEILFYKSVMDCWLKEGTTHKFRKQVKFIIRNLVNYKNAKKIANFIMEHPYLNKAIYKNPPLICTVLHKPYMIHNLSGKDKVEISTSSYRYLDNYFSKEALDILYKEKKLKILEISGKSEEKLTAYFRIFTNFDKEGEFNLHLYQEEKLLATLTFSIWNKKFFIGGLQGLGRNNNEPEILKEVTKDFYGIFPKKLLMEIFYNLFPEDKIAVGNSKHIYQALRYRFKKKRTVQASYDEFWESLGGIKRKDEIWELPKELKRKSMEEIPSKKRSQYRKRYEVLDKIGDLIQKFKEKYKR